MIDYIKESGYTLADYERERGDPNDADLDPEKVLLFLSTGQRIPQNEKEERWLKQIQEISDSGMALDIPSNGI